MIEINGTVVDPAGWRDGLEAIADVLCWYDGPRSYSCQINGRTALVHQVSESLTDGGWLSSYAVAFIDQPTLDSLKSGELAPRAVLEAGDLYVVAVGGDGSVGPVILVHDVTDLADCLPAADARYVRAKRE